MFVNERQPFSIRTIKKKSFHSSRDQLQVEKVLGAPALLPGLLTQSVCFHLGLFSDRLSPEECLLAVLPREQRWIHTCWGALDCCLGHGPHPDQDFQGRHWPGKGQTCAMELRKD